MLGRIAKRFESVVSGTIMESLQTLGIDSVKIFDRKYIIIESKSKVKIVGAVRLLGRPRVPSMEMTGNSYPGRLEYFSAFHKMKDLFSGLQKGGIPSIYMVLLNPIARQSAEIRSEVDQLEFAISQLKNDKRGLSKEILGEKEAELRRLRVGIKEGFFQTEVLFLSWIDGSRDDIKALSSKLDDNLDRLMAAIMAVFPEMEAVCLEKKELMKVLRSFLSPFLLPPTS